MNATFSLTMCRMGGGEGPPMNIERIECEKLGQAMNLVKWGRTGKRKSTDYFPRVHVGEMELVMITLCVARVMFRVG